MFAEFAVLLLGVPKPLQQTVLVDELDGAGADAGVEQRPLERGRAPAHPAYVWRFGSILLKKLFIL